MCKFVGGELDKEIVPRNIAVGLERLTGYTEDKTEWRNHGALVCRPELDNQPRFRGYIGPMWDGTIEIGGEQVGVLRYETQEVYNLLSM